MSRTPEQQAEWVEVCVDIHGRVLTGKHQHYCAEYDGLPVDETCPEFDDCVCVNYGGPV
jgi:hypothetical protein